MVIHGYRHCLEWIDVMVWRSETYFTTVMNSVMCTDSISNKYRAMIFVHWNILLTQYMFSCSMQRHVHSSTTICDKESEKKIAYHVKFFRLDFGCRNRIALPFPRTFIHTRCEIIGRIGPLVCHWSTEFYSQYAHGLISCALSCSDFWYLHRFIHCFVNVWLNWSVVQ